MRLNESLFSELFCADNGAPNASIRVMPAMMIIKENQDGQQTVGQQYSMA
jgi:hypothetical protein